MKITREFTFSSSHILPNHPKCQRPHGHNYKMIVELEKDKLENGMIKDYGELKKVIESWLKQLDHRFLVPTDSKGLKMKEQGSRVSVIFKRKGMCDLEIIGSNEDFCPLPITHSTAECLSERIFKTLKGIYPFLSSIIIKEGEETSAKYGGE